MEEKKECVWTADILEDCRQQDIMDIISHNFLKILKVNLTRDTHVDIMVAAEELEPENGYSKKFSEWMERLAQTDYINEQDRKNYLSFCNLEHLKMRFKTGSKWINCHYRRKVDGEFHWVALEIASGREYREDDQVVFLYVRDIQKDYLQSNLIPMLYQSNFQTIGIIDMKRGTIAISKGSLENVSELIYSEESYEKVRQRISIENIAPVDREAYLLRTTTENLKKKLEENDHYAFPI